jgi:curli biogenesis system outer membrane secretion channel CsgG
VAERGVGVAVWDLVDHSHLSEARPELAELLSTQIIDTLKQKRDYTVVERERLLLALEELGLGTTLLVDSATRLRLGRLVGAKLMVFGGYMIIRNLMRLDLRLVDVETGATLKAASQTATATDITAVLAVARAVTEKLL